MNAVAIRRANKMRKPRGTILLALIFNKSALHLTIPVLALTIDV